MMTKAFCTLITIFIAGILSAQTDDEAYKVCDDRVFTKVEILPDFKNGKAAFEDTLTGYLKKKNALPKRGNITYTFIVTMQSNVLDIKKMEGDVEYEDSVKAALISIPGIWKPAIQNTHQVCAYVSLKIDFSENKLTAKIVEPVLGE
ncbi:MAG TPA: hypothetical protein VF008_30900 [Niastella sp.]